MPKLWEIRRDKKGKFSTRGKHWGDVVGTKSAGSGATGKTKQTTLDGKKSARKKR